MGGVLEWYNEIFELADPRTEKLWLMGSPFPIVLITLGYLYYVKILGPRLMKDRPPYNLDTIIQYYNVFQIAFCLYLIYSANKVRMNVFSFFCEGLDQSNSPESLELLRLGWLYFILKLIDLLDTVFFVLRKKFNQVTFLHLYHHSLMFLVMWFVIKFSAGGHGCLMPYINCHVHVWMYGYYFVTNRWPEYKKNIWWKKYITILQILQFALFFLYTLPLLVIDCPYPKTMTYIVLTQNLVMVKMFTDFYRKTYMGKKEK